LDDDLVKLKVQRKGESPKGNTWVWIDVVKLDVKQLIWGSEEQGFGKSKEEIERTSTIIALK